MNGQKLEKKSCQSSLETKVIVAEGSSSSSDGSRLLPSNVSKKIKNESTKFKSQFFKKVGIGTVGQFLVSAGLAIATDRTVGFLYSTIYCS